MSDYLRQRQEYNKFGKPPKQQKVYSIPKKSAKKLKEEAAAKDENGDTELQKWFRARMKQMGDRCYWCGCKVENRVYQYAIYSICHILEKRKEKCPSVKTHPMNWLTLCPDHHTMFDGMQWEDREKLGFWDIIQTRLILVYPDLAKEEHRHFPQSVLDYMEKNKPF